MPASSYLLILAAACAWALSRPGRAPFLAFILFGFEQGLQANIGIFAFIRPLTNLIIGSVILAAAGLRLMSRRSATPLGAANPVTYCIFALYAVAVASILWTPAPDLAIDRLRSGFPYHMPLMVLLPILLDASRTSVARSSRCSCVGRPCSPGSC